MELSKATGLVGHSILNLKEIIESTPSCLKIINKKGQLLTMNPRGLGLIEADDENSVIGADVYSLVEATHRQKFIDFNNRICRGEKDYLIFEIVGLKGTKRWMETHAAPYILTNGELAHIAITNDITKKVADEYILAQQKDALADASRLTSLGQMAAGIAHEVNNPLSIILAKATQIKNKILEQDYDKEKIHTSLVQIEDTVLRISKIIHGLKNFSRNSKDDEKRVYSINTIIHETLALCTENFKNHQIDIQYHLPEEIEFNCFDVQLSQVLMNLLNNSFDVIIDQEEKWIKIELIKIQADNLIRLTVTDSGKGIPAEVVKDMMNPFFTTKEIGKGTGLGLSISMGIIKNHNGILKYNPDHANTQFIIEFNTVAIEKSKLQLV